jgi:hypothetical protein
MCLERLPCYSASIPKNAVLLSKYLKAPHHVHRRV